METKSVYIVSSYTNTLPGKMITVRASMKFWNRYPGDTYSHISLSKDSLLNDMVTFARKEITNPFNAGLVKEDIRKGLFASNPHKSKIAVMKLDVPEFNYDELTKNIDYYWNKKEELNYNYAGLVKMLFIGRGMTTENHYFCSQWVAQVLKESGINVFENKETYNIRPFDFYVALKKNIIYEGLTVDYPEYNIDNKEKIKKLI